MDVGVGHPHVQRPVIADALRRRAGKLILHRTRSERRPRLDIGAKLQCGGVADPGKRGAVETRHTARIQSQVVETPPIQVPGGIDRERGSGGLQQRTGSRPKRLHQPARFAIQPDRPGRTQLHWFGEGQCEVGRDINQTLGASPDSTHQCE